LRQHDKAGFEVYFVFGNGCVEVDLAGGDLELPVRTQRWCGAAHVAEDSLFHAGGDGPGDDILGCEAGKA
jgi:hypothetical protein